MKILVIKKRTLFICFAVILIAAILLGVCIKTIDARAAAPLTAKVIVLDAGHGGTDHGVVGSKGTKESDFNLKMTLKLAKILEDGGFCVVLTRETSDGLYGDAVTNRKRADMAQRKKIIVNSGADMVISLHANKYPSTDRRGAQVFFDELNKQGKSLAYNIQAGLNILNAEFVKREFSALKGDYFVLKCTHAPSVIVECGFLSNPEDEILLNDEGYTDRLAFGIYSGIVAYFETQEAN